MNIEELFDFSDAEHAILLTYCASLAHFERSVLRRLLRFSPGVQVELLMDATQAADSFFEAAALTSVGVDYRHTPVSLPGGVFHPKMFLLVGAHDSRLIITSANLTFFGLRDNAEIVCVADSSADDDDRALLWDAAELLTALATSVPVGASRSSLETVSLKIQGSIEARPVSDTRLLNNLFEPLLDQLSYPAATQRIAVLAPFVDKDFGSFRRIGAQFPDAALQLITSEGALAACDGAAAAELGSKTRAAVYTGFKEPPDSSRALHGKLFVFEGADDALTLMGSPNLSQAALLRSVAQGGNFEVAIQWPVAASGLLDRITTRDVTWSSFQRPPVGEERRSSEAHALTALSAEVEGEHLRVDAVGDSDARWSAQVRARTGTIDIELSVKSSNGRVLHLEGRSGALLRLPDEPTIVRVAAVSNESEAETLLWLGLASSLKRSGTERRADRLRRDLEASGEIAEEDTEDLALVFRAILASLARPTHHVPQKPEPVREEDEQDRALTGALVVEAPLDVSGSAAAFASPARAFSMANRLASAFRSAESLDSASEDTRRDWEEGSRGSGSSKRSTLTKRSGLRIRDELRSATQVWEDWPERAADLPAAADFTDLTLRTLPHYALRFASEGKDDLAVELARLQLHAVRAAFSIDGTERGRPAGWLIRAWVDDRKALKELLVKEDRLESLIASFGATVSICEVIEDATSGSDVSFILAAAGLRLLGMNEVDWDRVAGHARRIASPASEIVSGSGMVGAARQQRRQPKLVEAARIWEPLLRGGRVSPSGPDWVSKLSTRNLAQLGVAEEGLYCGECLVALPVAQQRALMQVAPVECQNCGYLLVPYSYESKTTGQILAALLNHREGSQ